MWGRRGRHHLMVVGLITITLQSVPITAKVVSSNSVYGGGILDTTLCDKVCQ